MAGRRVETVTVTIVRTGGVAGLRREWTATASGSDADAVRALVDSDAWVTVSVDPGSRDRFVWSIVVTGAGRRRTVKVPEARLDGALQELVSRVQQDGDPVAPPEQRNRSAG